jgi:hypothetical protein
VFLIPETNMTDVANAVELESAATRGVPASALQFGGH